MIDRLLSLAFRVFYRFDTIENRDDDKNVVSLTLRVSKRFGWAPFRAF